jgi:hypothetical protein
MNEISDHANTEKWTKSVEHGERLQQEDFEQETGREQIMEKVTIHMADGSSSDSDRSEDEDD